jgi:Rps23 Pro-64 3,4-dihydroxylase Tpa1-like proline 4-hydroxylase
MIKNPSAKDEIYLKNVEKIGKSPENIRLIEDVLSEEEHATLLDYVKTNELWTLEPWDCYSVKMDKLPVDILNMLEKIFAIVHKNATQAYRVDIDYFEKVNIALLKFAKGLVLHPHVDTDSAESNHIASIYYINDDFTGGELCFPELNINIKPKPNSLVFFPGNENYLHEVKTISSGNRYSSSMWFQFTGSTFNKNAEWYR